MRVPGLKPRRLSARHLSSREWNVAAKLNIAQSFAFLAIFRIKSTFRSSEHSERPKELHQVSLGWREKRLRLEKFGVCASPYPASDSGSVNRGSNPRPGAFTNLWVSSTARSPQIVSEPAISPTCACLYSENQSEIIGSR
jgi:hypothetical protein